MPAQFRHSAIPDLLKLFGIVRNILMGIEIAIGIFKARIDGDPDTDSDTDIRRWRQNLDSIVFP